ncbi:MAG: hypothetical protein AAGC55_06135, partial [Myxococcota bacterium]
MLRAWQVTGNDIARWAEEYNAASVLPTLVRRLLRATSPVRRIEMRADAGVRLSGWDGIVEARAEAQYCPGGFSVWELTTQKDKSKFDGDFDKRSENPGAGIAPARTSYVVVTARRYSGKQNWMKKQRDRGPWKDVRLLDADDLATWLEHAPAVAAWFAADQLARPVDGVSDIATYLDRWSQRSTPPLTHTVVRAGRDREMSALQNWLERLPDTRPDEHRTRALEVHADSSDEALLFVASALTALPHGQPWLERAVVVEHQQAWRWAMRAETDLPLLLLPDFERFDPGEARSYGGPSVIPREGRADSTVGALRLPPMLPEDMAQALVAGGFDAMEARDLAHRADGQLAQLQILCDYHKRPPWADASPSAPLLAMLVAGAWAPGNPADRQTLGNLGSDADAVDELCTGLANSGDPPIEQVQGVWKWRAPAAAWKILVRKLSRSQLERFADAAAQILGQRDPRFDMAPEERLYAAMQGKTLAESSQLRHGLAESLAYLAVNDDALAAVHGRRLGSKYAADVVCQVLQPAWQHWASLSDLLPILAETAPRQFIDAMAASLAREDGVARLLGQEEGLFGSSPHTGLLWALEALGWNKEHLPMVVTLLAELAAKDPGGGRHANRPAASLLDLLHPWAPQSITTVEERMQLFNNVAKEQPEVGWQLGIAMLRSLNGRISTGSYRPRYRPWQLPDRQSVFSDDAETNQQADAAVAALIALCACEPLRQAKLLEAVTPLGQERIEQVLGALEAAHYDSDKARVILRDALREQLYLLYLRHDDFAESPLANRIHTLHKKLDPEDLVLRHTWLFAGIPKLPQKYKVEDHDKLIQEHRHEALSELMADERRWDLVRRLSQRLKEQGQNLFHLGQSLVLLPPDQVAKVHEHLLINLDESAYEDLIPVFLSEQFKSLDHAWLISQLKRLVESGQVTLAARTAARTGGTIELWDWLDQQGVPLHARYWESVHWLPRQPDLQAWTRAITNLLEYGNLTEALRQSENALRATEAP